MRTPKTKAARVALEKALTYINASRGGSTGRCILAKINKRSTWWRMYGAQWLALKPEQSKPEGFP